MSEMQQLVELVAQKTKTAAALCQPLAEEVLRQYQTRALVHALGSLVGFLLSVALVVFGLIAIGKWDCEEGGVAGVIVGLGACLLSVVFIVTSFGHYIAPLPSLLGR